MENKVNPVLFIGNPQWLSYYYKKYSKEKFTSVPNDGNGSSASVSRDIALITLYIVLSIIIWISTVVRLIIKGHEMPVWAVVISVLLLFLPVPFGVFIAFGLTFLKSGNSSSPILSSPYYR